MKKAKKAPSPIIRKTEIKGWEQTGRGVDSPQGRQIKDQGQAGGAVNFVGGGSGSGSGSGTDRFAGSGDGGS